LGTGVTTAVSHWLWTTPSKKDLLSMLVTISANSYEHFLKFQLFDLGHMNVVHHAVH